MRLGELVREAWASVRAQRVPTVMVAVLVAAMCATTVLTVGRADAAQEQVQARLDAAGARQLRVGDAKHQGFLTPSVISLVAGMDTVERAVGLSAPADVTNAAVQGDLVTAWTVTGDLRDVLTLTAGRWPAPGEALVSSAAQELLGMDQPAGAISGTAVDATSAAVVGSYQARAPFDDLATGVVVAGSGAASQHLAVIATTAATAGATQRAVLSLLARADPADLSVESPATLAEIQQDVLGDLAGYGRSLMLLVLGAGALLVAVVVLADVLLRRVDLGRRRALGAARWTIIALVVMRTGIAATVGALLGTGAAVAVVHRSGQPPDVSFAAGTAVLAILTALIAAAPPAVAAAGQDPVRVLRTP